MDQERGEIFGFLFGFLAGRTHTPGPLIQHVADEIGTRQFHGVPGGLDDGDTLMTENQVAELVRERPIPGRESFLQEEHVTVVVLAPLSTDPGGKIGHGYLDRAATILTDRFDETGK